MTIFPPDPSNATKAGISEDFKESKFLPDERSKVLSRSDVFFFVFFLEGPAFKRVVGSTSFHVQIRVVILSILSTFGKI